MLFRSYSDGSEEIREFYAVDKSISWSEDHVTKIIEYICPDGTKSTERILVEPLIENVRYIQNKKNIKFIIIRILCEFLPFSSNSSFSNLSCHKFFNPLVISNKLLNSDFR